MKRGARAAGAVVVLALAWPRAARAQDAASIAAPAKTEALVQQFAQDFSLLRYDEDVRQTKLKTKDGDKIAYEQETVFDSIVRIHTDEGKLNVEEQRLMEKRPVHVEARPLLSTYGFSTAEMIFHPYYAESFRFTSLGNDTLEGKPVLKIGFAHIPGTATPVLYQSFGPDRALELTGTAWIDAGTGEIYRIDESVPAGIAEIGVQMIHASVLFQPVLLGGESAPQMLPASATIDLETPKQHWRNIHRFSDYRKYRVSSNVPGVVTP